MKIRLQVAGEIMGGQKVRAWAVVKELGLFGLYKVSRKFDYKNDKKFLVYIFFFLLHLHKFL